jgi:hypothetical protein
MPDTESQRTRWDLRDLLPSPSGAELDKHLGDLESATTRVESYRAKLLVHFGVNRTMI